MDAVNYLSAQSDVKYVEQDSVVTISQDCQTQLNCPWGLARISVRIPSGDGGRTYRYNRFGQGVDCYTVDTGVRITHSQFEGRAIHGANFIPGEDITDLNGHGTHVSGTIAGRDYGVAKNANIVNVKVLNSGGSGSWDGVIAGLNFCGQRQAGRPRRAVVNMSLGGAQNNAVDAACIALGREAIVVVAAGNNGQDCRSYSPGNLGNTSMDIISMAAMVERAAGQSFDSFASFSNHGTGISAVAPGASVLSCWYTSDTATNTLSGTSMASPHGAGVVALIFGEKMRDEMTTPAAKKQFLDDCTTGTFNTRPGVGTTDRIAYTSCEGPSM